MLDIETYGLTPGSVIKSIGAVKFGSGKIIDRFYHRIDAQSCTRFGLTMDAVTVEWWLGQDDKARKEMTLPGDPIRNVIQKFGEWINEPKAEICGNGAAFNVLVACAAAAVGLPAVWAHKKSFCYRTVKNLHRHIPIDSFRVGTHHNALDDAESQALHLMAIWEYETRLAGAAGQLGSAVALANRIKLCAEMNGGDADLAQFDSELARLEKVVNTPVLTLYTEGNLD